MRTVLGKIRSSMQAEKVSSRLGLFSGMRSCLTLKASKQVYTSILQVLLDYADVAWGESSDWCC